ncbi:MAG: hypothetical protein GX361_10305 [Bacteroidales bacterium]|nr:hypothetical protein [Bacteroidales bacterium]
MSGRCFADLHMWGNAILKATLREKTSNFIVAHLPMKPLFTLSFARALMVFDAEPPVAIVDFEVVMYDLICSDRLF